MDDKEFLTKEEFDNFLGNHFEHLKDDVQDVMGGLETVYEEVSSARAWTKGVMYVMVPLVIAIVASLII